MLVLLSLLSPAHATGTAVVSGQMCDATHCYTYTATLYDKFSIRDSLGRSGTYTLKPSSTGGMIFDFNFPRQRISGSLTASPGGCWVAATSPLNPALGSVNVCLTSGLQQFQEYDASCDSLPLQIIAPLSDEGGHFAAGRITPAYAGGMWISSITYALNTTYAPYSCGKPDHEIQLFVGPTTGAPPATPTVLVSLDVDGATLGDGDTSNTVYLPQPLFVDGDESLWISLQQVYDVVGGTSCPAICQWSPTTLDESYWSNSAVTPYPWADFDTFGLGDLMVKAQGVNASP